MSSKPKFVALLVLISAALLSFNSSAQTLDCGPLVSLNNGVITVEPAPDDDTEEIQCALDSAVDLGVTTVKLTAGVFAISQVRAERFVGSLQGQSKATTALFVFDNSIDCDAERAAGRTPAAIKFVNGNARLATMTLDIGEPCISTAGQQFAFIHFTGSDALSGCESETGFGVVDRVDIFNFNRAEVNSFKAAAAAYAEGLTVGGCRETQLGTFKLNRSTVFGFQKGVDVRLRGAGQVDINFSQFLDNAIGVFSDDANQLLTIQSNEFVASSDFEYEGASHILVSNSDFGPSQNRVVVYNNDFGFLDIGQGHGVWLDAAPGVAMSAAITNNFFVGGGDTGVVMNLLVNIDGAAITGNIYAGASFSGVEIANGNSSVITGNNFSPLSPSAGDNVYLDQDSQNNIVGPLQGAIVFDLGMNNTVLGPQMLEPESSSTPDAARPPLAERTDWEAYVANARERLAVLAAQKGVPRVY